MRATARVSWTVSIQTSRTVVVIEKSMSGRPRKTGAGKLGRGAHKLVQAIAQSRRDCRLDMARDASATGRSRSTGTPRPRSPHRFLLFAHGIHHQPTRLFSTVASESILPTAAMGDQHQPRRQQNWRVAVLRKCSASLPHSTGGLLHNTASPAAWREPTRQLTKCARRRPAPRRPECCVVSRWGKNPRFADSSLPRDITIALISRHVLW